MIPYANLNFHEWAVLGFYDDPPEFRANLILSVDSIRSQILKDIANSFEEDKIVRDAANAKLKELDKSNKSPNVEEKHENEKEFEL